MDIRIGELDNPAIIQLLSQHHVDMLSHSPPESVHALDLSTLKAPNITFYSLWVNNELAGCGAFKTLDDLHGEIKSMRTAKKFLRQGVAKKLLHHIIVQAKANHYHRISLETGSLDVFAPARQLYLDAGFTFCPPFSNYKEDPYSNYMTLVI